MLILLSLLACAPRGLSPDQPVPDFELVDQNLSSATYGLPISPLDYEGQVSAWYFGAGSCGYCIGQLSYLWQIQQELEIEATLHGINSSGQEAWNDEAIEGHDLPWLQDRDDMDAWGVWDVRYRDVIVVDADSYPVATYNLTSSSLSDPDNLEALKVLIEGAAD